MCNCGKYKLYNLESNRGRVTAIFDGTCINIGNRQKVALDARQTFEIDDLQSGDVITSCKPIYGSGELGTASFEMIPDYFKGSIFGTTRSRYTNVRYSIYSIDATSIVIERNKGIVTTLALTPGQVTTYVKTNPYTGSYDFVANGNVVITGVQNTASGDSSLIGKPSNDIVGWASSSAYIASESAPTTTFTAYNNLVNTSYTGTIATTYNIVNSADFAGLNANNLRYFDVTSAMRMQGNDLYGESRADGDGGNNTPFWRVQDMTTHHVIPQPTEFISFVSNVPTTIQWTNQLGVIQPLITLTKTSTQTNAPYAARIGTPNGASNFTAGQMFVANNPVHVVYQPKGAGIYGSDDDESVSLGYNI